MPKRRQKKISKSQFPITKKNKKNARKLNKQSEKNEAVFLNEEKIKKSRVKNFIAPEDENFIATKQPPAIVENIIESGDSREEKKKKLVMWVGISSIMAVFFIAWIFTVKYEFRVSTSRSAGPAFNWSQAKAELANAMAQVKQGVEQIKQIQKSVPGVLPKEPSLTPEQINLLKGKLLNEVASSTASSTVK